MCDPITLTAVALTAAGTAANAKAGSNARKSAQGTMNANTAAQGVQFDKRMGELQGSDGRVMDLTQRQYDDGAALDDQSFSTLLGYSKERADSSDLTARGLLTTQKALQDNRVATKSSEALRQSGFLEKMMSTVTEAISSAAPGSQTAMAAQMFGNRMGVMGSALGSGAPTEGPTPAGDDLVQRAFASRADAAHADGMAEGAARSRVGSMTDAASWADQILGQGGASADLTKGRADLSQGFTDASLGQIDASDELAQQHANFADSLASWLQEQKSGSYADYATKTGGAQDDYYGRSLDSENTFTTGMTGSSQHLEDTNTSLANYKIQNTKADTTFGDLLKAGGSALAMGAGGAGGGTNTFGGILRARTATPITGAPLSLLARPDTYVSGLRTMPGF